jgi:hypothetical protein
VINIWLMVSQTADVQMIADPSVILATVEEVRRAGNNAKDYADDIVSTLENETREAMHQRSAPPFVISGKRKTRRHGPVYSQHVDRMSATRGQRGRIPVRTEPSVAKADGSNVGATGGSDTVTLQRANLPAVQIDVSGETSEQPEQKLTTTRGGIHHHGGVAGKDDLGNRR